MSKAFWGFWEANEVQATAAEKRAAFWRSPGSSSPAEAPGCAQGTGLPQLLSLLLLRPPLQEGAKEVTEGGDTSVP